METVAGVETLARVAERTLLLERDPSGERGDGTLGAVLLGDLDGALLRALGLLQQALGLRTQSGVGHVSACGVVGGRPSVSGILPDLVTLA